MLNAGLQPNLTCAMTTTKAPHNHNNHNTTHQHGHHGTHAPHIGEGFTFKYDIISQRMAIVSNHQCWIYNPSDDEKSHIQDIHVLRNLEVKLIQLIDSNPSSTPMTHDDLALMSSSLAHTCHPGWQIYVLN
ncbi:uncharacterized protein LOC132552253 [Ylistrum balloti]|uniref:uncharacterized protein LOC132552253 n=1 Tax=Ylistrum balloti TaxID=509963 RepID=UPI002905C2FA|nr:uncharacterized protein LOC132552253 [Ylistrum balloti]